VKKKGRIRCRQEMGLVEMEHSLKPEMTVHMCLKTNLEGLVTYDSYSRLIASMYQVRSITREQSR
jgi:hypothetical protein